MQDLDKYQELAKKIFGSAEERRTVTPGVYAPVVFE